MMKSIIFTRPTSLSPGINRSYFLSYTSPLNFQSVPCTAQEKLSPAFIYPQFRTVEYRGEFVPPRLLFRERVQSFSPSRSHRATVARGAVRGRVGPKKVYRKMAARIYVIRGRRLFPSFLHLLCTTAATTSSATRWVVQRRGAGTTQLPRKLLHNKTACTFSYSRLFSACPLSPSRLRNHSYRSFSLFLSVCLHFYPLSLSLFPYFPLSVLSLRSTRRKSIGTVHLCACWSDRKKGGETSISKSGKGIVTAGNMGVSFLRVFRKRKARMKETNHYGKPGTRVSGDDESRSFRRYNIRRD